MTAENAKRLYKHYMDTGQTANAENIRARRREIVEKPVEKPKEKAKDGKKWKGYNSSSMDNK